MTRCGPNACAPIFAGAWLFSCLPDILDPAPIHLSNSEGDDLLFHDVRFSAPLTRLIAFFDNHAIGLSRLDEAIAAVTGAAPNADRAAHAVSALRDALADVRVAELDEVATTTSTVGDPYATLTWYGARLSDLAANLCAADVSRS